MLKKIFKNKTFNYYYEKTLKALLLMFMFSIAVVLIYIKEHKENVEINHCKEVINQAELNTNLKFDSLFTIHSGNLEILRNVFNDECIKNSSDYKVSDTIIYIDKGFINKKIISN